MITIHNDGPLIVQTNYWDSPLNAAGKIWVSVNAGTIRVLLPDAFHAAIADISAAKYCILTRGPWPAANRADAVELLFEDLSDSPYCLHLGAESFDLLPAPPPPGQHWRLSVWIRRDHTPTAVIADMLVHFRTGTVIPCLFPL